MNKQSKHMFLYEFDQEGRRAMILQLGNFKGNVTWFLFFEYLIDLNEVISKAAETIDQEARRAIIITLI